MTLNGPVVLLFAGILIIGAIGGAVIVLDAGSPLTTQSTGAVVQQPTETSSPQLRATTTSQLVDDEQELQVRIEAVFENRHDTAVEQNIAVRIDGNRDGTFETTAGKQALSIPGKQTVTLGFVVAASRLGAGTYDYVVESADGTVDYATGSFTLRPVEFVVTGIQGQAVFPGEPATITATLSNVGDFSGTPSITLAVDSNLDGTFQASEQVTGEAVSFSDGDARNVTVLIPTASMEPGRYPVRISTGSDSRDTELLISPGFRVDSLNVTDNVTRGTPVRISVGVTNAGDLPGNRTVTLLGPSETHNQTVALAARQTTTLNFTVETATLEPGNHTFTVLTDGPAERFDVRVRAPRFEVSELGGTGTYALGEVLTFSARLHNAGDAMGVQQVELRIDVDGDDTPESVGIVQEVGLAPGERTMITFTVDRYRWSEVAPETSQLGSHIVGIFTNETNVTGVFAVKQTSSRDSRDTAGEPQDIASRDEISQDKYGRFYSALSEETQDQIDELYTRQPFAEGLVVTEVLTREEIAREQFGYASAPGDPFDFTDLDIQVQQDVEAIFDAQFTSEHGDRIESWEELAQTNYGQSYDQLTAEQQEAIKVAYLEQFDAAG